MDLELVTINGIKFIKIKDDGEFIEKYGEKLFLFLDNYTQYFKESDIDTAKLFFGFGDYIYIKESYYDQDLLKLLNNYELFNIQPTDKYLAGRDFSEETSAINLKIHVLESNDEILQILQTLAHLPNVIKFRNKYWIKKPLAKSIKEDMKSDLKTSSDHLTGGSRIHDISYKELYKNFISNIYHLIK